MILLFTALAAASPAHSAILPESATSQVSCVASVDLLPQGAEFRATGSAIAGWFKDDWLCSVHGHQGRGITQWGAVLEARSKCRAAGGNDNGVVPWCEQSPDWCREI